MKRGQSWDGGHVYENRHGRSVYIIRRQVAGQRYEVSTHCTDLERARVQLRRFGVDPAGYTPRT